MQIVKTTELLFGLDLMEKPPEIVARINREWDLNERYQGVLKKHGTRFIPTWKNLLFGKGGLESLQHWRLDVEVPLNGKMMDLELRAIHPLESFDISVRFPESGAKLAMAPKGNRTNPMDDTALCLAYEILLKIEDRLM